MASRHKAASMVVAMLVSVFVAAGCSGVKRVEKGKACWYGPGYEGRRTASGEVLNGNAFTAAHRKLPFNTIVRVTNLNNGREVKVRINDRGPFKGGRIIDLSEAAARELGMIQEGIVPVRIEVLRLGRQR